MRLPLSVALLLTGSALAADPPMPDATVAATVNGEVIRLDEVDARVRQRPLTGGPLTAAQARRLRLAHLDDLIDERLVAQFLKQHGPKLEPAEADRNFAALVEALRRQKKTVPEFAKELGLTPDQLREAHTLRLQFQKYVEARATDEELRKYHAAYKEFFDRAAVKVSHIVVRVGPTAPPGERAAARQKLAAVRTEIAGGKITFADAAKQYSIDATAAAGGEIGYITRKDTIVDEAFCRAAFALKVGDVSEPVDTEYGVHLILVTERKAGTPRTFDQVADEVRDCYTDDVRQNLLAQLRKAASIQVTVP